MKIKNAPNLKKVWKAYRTGKTSSLNKVEKKTLKGIKERLSGKRKSFPSHSLSKRKNPNKAHIHTAKFRSCVKKIKKSGAPVNAYAVCESAIGYKGSVLPSHMRENPEILVRESAPLMIDGERVSVRDLKPKTIMHDIGGRTSVIKTIKPTGVSDLYQIDTEMLKNPRFLESNFPLTEKKKIVNTAVNVAAKKMLKGWDWNDVVEYLEEIGYSEKIAEAIATTAYNYITTPKGKKLIPFRLNPYDQYGRYFQTYFTGAHGVVRPLAGKAVRRKLHKETHAIPLRRYIKPNARKKKAKLKKKKIVYIGKKSYTKKGKFGAPLIKSKKPKTAVKISSNEKFIRYAMGNRDVFVAKRGHILKWSNEKKTKTKKKIQKKVLIRIGRKLYKGTQTEVNKLIKAGYRKAKTNPRFIGGKGKMTAIEYKATDNALYRHDFKKPRKFNVVNGKLVAAPVPYSKDRGLLG